MRRALVFLALLVLACAGLFAWQQAASPVQAPLTLELPLERAWNLRWTSRDVTALTGDELASSLALSATLRARRVDAHVFEARLEHPTLSKLEFLGQPAGLEAQLLSAPVRLTLDDAARTTGVAFEEGTDPLAAHLLSALFDELRLDLDAANAAREVEEPNRQGRGLTRYERTLAGFARVALRQLLVPGLEHAAFVTAGRDELSWDGFVTTRHAQRTLEATVQGKRLLSSSGELELEPREVPATPWNAVAAWVPHERFAVSARAEAAALDQRIGGLDGVTLLDTLSRFGPSGQVPNHARFLREASALLEKDPRLCLELERHFFEPAGSFEAGRTLTLDLLTSAGTPEAQASLRRLLDDPRTRAERSWPLWLQRLSLLQHPTRETGAFALEQLERATSRDAVGASSAVAGAVSRGVAAVEPALARELQERLQAGFAAASGRDRDAWTLALGNTRAEAVRPQLDLAANDASPAVRTTAAWALGSLEGARGQATLSRLAGDLDPGVREAAIHSLAQGPFSLPLVSAALAAAPDARTDPAWVNLLAPHLAEPGVREVLEQVLARTTEPALAGRLRTLLAG